MRKAKSEETSFSHATKPIKPVNRLAAIVTSKTSRPAKVVPLNLEELNGLLNKLVAATNENNKVVRAMKPDDADKFVKKLTSIRSSCYDKLRSIYAMKYKNYNQIIAARLKEIADRSKRPLPDDFIKFVNQLR